MSELKQFKLPDVGEGLMEADIVKWLVQPGDKISTNQIIVEIETAKAVVELPSPYEGVVENLLVPEGATADVGTPIISVQVGDPGVRVPADAAPDAAAAPPPGASAPVAAAPPDASAPRAAATDDIAVPPAEGAVEPGIHGSPAPKEERQAVLVGYGVKLGATKRRARKPAAAGTAARPLAASGAAGPAGPAGAGGSQGHRVAVLAKPPVRKLAKDLGVD